MKSTKPWYEKYLKGYIRQLWGWAPARKAVKKRAQVAKLPEAFKCEKCGTSPLSKGQYEINHIEPCESLDGWSGGGAWNGFIARAIAIEPSEAELICKPCHKAITKEQNSERRKRAKANG